MIALAKILLWIGVGCIGLAVLIVARDYKRQHKAPRMRTVVQHEDRSQVIGDGAWTTTAAQYPRSARVRDIDPRGA
jgi:hypothetical protein